jgi:hypothetical protein
MRPLSLLLACVFCFSLLCGCGGENNKTDPSKVKYDTASKIGTGKQRGLEKPGTPTID